MGYDGNPNGSDLTIVTVVLQYGVFARDYAAQVKKGYPSQKNMDDDSSDKRDWGGILGFIFYDTIFFLALVWLVIHFFGME